MSIISQAKAEMDRIGFKGEDQKTMVEILEKFFDQWDSGGAVHAVAPILQRCIAGKPLSPLTGDADEWNEVGDGVYQNNRMGSVFKDPRFHGGLLAYDIDAAEPRAAITFPYLPAKADVASPVVTIET